MSWSEMNWDIKTDQIHLISRQTDSIYIQNILAVFQIAAFIFTLSCLVLLLVIAGVCVCVIIHLPLCVYNRGSMYFCVPESLQWHWGPISRVDYVSELWSWGREPNHTVRRRRGGGVGWGLTAWSHTNYTHTKRISSLCQCCISCHHSSMCEWQFCVQRWKCLYLHYICVSLQVRDRDTQKQRDKHSEKVKYVRWTFNIYCIVVFDQ